MNDEHAGPPKQYVDTDELSAARRRGSRDELEFLRLTLLQAEASGNPDNIHETLYYLISALGTANDTEEALSLAREHAHLTGTEQRWPLAIAEEVFEALGDGELSLRYLAKAEEILKASLQEGDFGLFCLQAPEWVMLKRFEMLVIAGDEARSEQAKTLLGILAVVTPYYRVRDDYLARALVRFGSRILTEPYFRLLIDYEIQELETHPLPTDGDNELLTSLKTLLGQMDRFPNMDAV